MSEETLWMECLEDFLVGASDGGYHHSQKNIIQNDKMLVAHTMHGARETLSWHEDKRTHDITGVKHIGR